MSTISELIEVNEIKLKTITDLIQHKETPKEDMDKLLSCRRFISSFILELRGLNESNLLFENYLTSIRNDVKKQPKNDVEKGFQIAVVLIHLDDNYKEFINMRNMKCKTLGVQVNCGNFRNKCNRIIDNYLKNI